MRAWIRVTTMDKKTLLGQVKRKVREVCPDAEIILYGSRARGTQTAGSDWDFLVLTDASLRQITDRIRHQIYEVEWDSGEVLSSIVRSRRDWNSDRYRQLPFHRNIVREGVKL